ncbi:MAG: type II toxin-antitoxin system prevent-host-death family antitoxin [Rhizobiaceae bacterium]|nr:type II toxin-antitoxin system prevent-host-death family antitoxin [Rhizobiaceae bacterium]
MRHVNFTEFRKNLATHLDRVVDDRAELLVTGRNREPVVVVSQSDWEGMKETAYLLASPANAERLLKSIADADAGRLVEHDLIDP